jgi:sugar lactone lactonase YvrE
MPLQINFVPNIPPQGKRMNIQNVPYIQPPIGHIVKAKLLALPAFKPIPPATVTVNLVNQTGINVSWLGHKKATYYTVFVYSSSSSSMTSPTLVFTQNLATSGTTISFSPTDGLYYGCSVQVFNANFGANTANISAISTGLLYTAPVEGPTVTAPTSVTLSSLTGTGATVTWSGGSVAVSYNVTIYYNSSASVTTSNSQVAQSPYVSVISGSTFSFTASDITYYAATVTVINLDGQATSSISSAVEYFVAPGQPTANTPTNTGTTLNMTWSAPASGGSSITSYTVYVLANGSAASTLTPGLVTSTTFSPMISGTAYTFYVVANGNGGSGTQSTTSSAVTYYAAPGQVTANTPTNTGTTLNMAWSAPSGSVTAYTVYVLAAGSLAPSGTLSLGNVTSTTFTPMVSGTAYSFYVVATGPGGSGTQSTTTAEVTYTAPPGQATVNTPTNTGTTLNMTWSAPGSGEAVTGYTVYVLAAGSLAPSGTLSLGNVTSTTFSPMVSGTAYSFYVVATGVGGSGTQSTTSATVTYTAAPVAPTTVTLASLTETGATVTWSGGSGATSYTVQIYSSASSNMSSPSTVSQTPSSSTTVTSPQAFTFTASSGLYYGAIVTAVNSGGSTASSMSSGVVYNSSPVTAPTTVTLSSLTGSGATVTWSGDSGATSYTCQIYYSTASNMSSPAIVSQSPSSSTSVSSGQSFSFSAEDSLYYGAIITAINAGGSVASSMSTGVQFIGTYSGSGPVSTLATGFGNLYNLAIDSSENIYLADYGGHKTWRIPSGGSPSILAGSTTGLVNGNAASAKFNGPAGIAVTADGSTVYVADYGNSKIRMITGGTVTTLAGGTHGAWLDGASNVARFFYPSGIAIDRTGTVLFIGDKLTHRIRVVTIATGDVTTLAGGANSTVGSTGAYADGTGASASFNQPLGLCVGLDNSVYVADSGNQRIRKVTYPGGVVTTFAGRGVNGFLNGTGTGARFSAPYGVAMDSYGILYVADKDSKRIRQITSAGVVTTFAGTGTNTNVDNANRLLATFVQPTGVVVNSSRTALYVTQTATPAVRKITLN